METRAERRLRKLRALCEQHQQRGGVVFVAETAGLNANTLDQVLKGALLPAKADGTRTARTVGDKAATAIEDAFKLGRGWFDADDATMPTSKPVPAAPQEQTVAATLDRLGELLAKADPKTRDAVAQLLMSYAQDPDQGKRIAQAIEVLLGKDEPPNAPAEAPKALRGKLIREGVAAPVARPRKVKG